MSEEAALPATPESTTTSGGEVGFEQLKLLFDYPKFHIGIYLTLALR